MNLELASTHRAMRDARFGLPYRVYHLTVPTFGRAPVFAEVPAAWAACRSFNDPANAHGARMLAWVLMPDHVHWLLQLGATQPLHRVVNRLKTISAARVNEARDEEGRLWALDHQDRMLGGEDDITAIFRDLIEYPLRAGLAECVGDYPYWNTTWL